MKITDFNNPDLIHAVTLYADDNEDTKIYRDWHLHRSFKNTIGDDDLIDHEGIVYFICVDDEIVKVGGSTDSIKGLLGQYIMNLEAKGNPMFTRFPIYLMMLELLCNNSRIDYYYIPVQPYTIVLKNLVNGKPVAVQATDFHGFETGYIQHVMDLCGSVPAWNVAEGADAFSGELRQLWETRREQLAGHGPMFDYAKFLNRA